MPFSFYIKKQTNKKTNAYTNSSTGKYKFLSLRKAEDVLLLL